MSDENLKARSLYDKPIKENHILKLDSMGNENEWKKLIHSKGIQLESQKLEANKNYELKIQKNDKQKIKKSFLEDTLSMFNNSLKKTPFFNSNLHTKTSFISNSDISLIFKGIPFSYKKSIWKFFISHRPFFKNISNDEYQNLHTKISGFEYQIHVDIQRTFRNLSLYQTSYSEKQCELFRCLVAFSNFNKKIGYCQGMASFTGFILIFFDELSTFIFLKNILYNYESLFDKKLSLLPRLLFLQKEIILLFIPEIFYILKQEDVDYSLFLYQWYLTLFSRFDINLTNRIWDIFIFFDFKILPIVTAGILSFFKNNILMLKGESLIKFLNNIENQKLSIKDVDQILEIIFEMTKRADLEGIENSLKNECM